MNKKFCGFCFSLFIILLGGLAILCSFAYLGTVLIYLFSFIRIDTLSALAGMASAIAAIVGIFISVQTKVQQKELQLRQMKLDKFEVLFEFYDVLLEIKNKMRKLNLDKHVMWAFLLKKMLIKEYLHILDDSNNELKVLRKSMFIVDEKYVENIELIYEKLSIVFNFFELLYQREEHEQFHELNKKKDWIKSLQQPIIENVELLLEILEQDLDISNVHKI